MKGFIEEAKEGAQVDGEVRLIYFRCVPGGFFKIDVLSEGHWWCLLSTGLINSFPLVLPFRIFRGPNAFSLYLVVYCSKWPTLLLRRKFKVVKISWKLMKHALARSLNFFLILFHFFLLSCGRGPLEPQAHYRYNYKLNCMITFDTYKKIIIEQKT